MFLTPSLTQKRQRHYQGLGGLVVPPLHIPGTLGLELPEDGGHDPHQEQGVEEQQAEDGQLVEEDVRLVVRDEGAVEGGAVAGDQPDRGPADHDQEGEEPSCQQTGPVV